MNPALSPQLDLVFQHALAKKPAQRFLSILTFSEAFTLAVEGQLTRKHLATLLSDETKLDQLVVSQNSPKTTLLSSEPSKGWSLLLWILAGALALTLVTFGIILIVSFAQQVAVTANDHQATVTAIAQNAVATTIAEQDATAAVVATTIAEQDATATVTATTITEQDAARNAANLLNDILSNLGCVFGAVIICLGMAAAAAGKAKQD